MENILALIALFCFIGIFLTLIGFFYPKIIKCTTRKQVLKPFLLFIFILIGCGASISHFYGDEIKAREKIENEKQIEKILVDLKSIPENEYQKNKELYEKLVVLAPDNSEYTNKADFFQKKISEKQAEITAKETRKKLVESQFSPWDGSHRNLEKFIKEHMNDPDSYQHDETLFSDKGDHLIVLTKYRGKNGFGGVVREHIKAKITLDGTILQILENE